MLTKPPLVTVIPAVPGREGRAASHECATFDPNSGGGISDGGDPTAPTDPGSTGSYTPAAGEHILLHDGGGYTDSVAPAPAGYTCRLETNPVITPAGTWINVVVCEAP